MKQIIIVIFLLANLCSCVQKPKAETIQMPQEEPVYPQQVGDIAFDPAIDDPKFKVCDENQVFQYYNFSKGMQYRGEKPKIARFFRERLKITEKKGESGYVTIRFVVNCEGKTGRFRTQEMSEDYQPKNFNDTLTKQLLDLTRQLDGWVVAKDQGQALDYYQYLTFKIENGNLIEIMP